MMQWGEQLIFLHFMPDELKTDDSGRVFFFFFRKLACNTLPYFVKLYNIHNFGDLCDRIFCK